MPKSVMGKLILDTVESLRSGLPDRPVGRSARGMPLGDCRWPADALDRRGIDPELLGDLPALASELVRMKVDVILAPASTQVEPARQATKTIPIVFAQHADPIGVGHVAILKEAVPRTQRVGVLWNFTTPSHPLVLAAAGGRSRR